MKEMRIKKPFANLFFLVVTCLSYGCVFSLILYNHLPYSYAMYESHNRNHHQHDHFVIAEKVLLPVNILEGEQEKIAQFMVELKRRENENHSAAKVESGHGNKSGAKVIKFIFLLTAAISLIYLFSVYYSSSAQYASPSFHYSVPSYPNYYSNNYYNNKPYYYPIRTTTASSGTTAATTQSSGKGSGRRRRSDYDRQEEYDEITQTTPIPRDFNDEDINDKMMKQQEQDSSTDMMEWLSIIDELWNNAKNNNDQDDACLLRLLCRVNQMAVKIPGPAGIAASIYSSLPLNYLLLQRKNNIERPGLFMQQYLDASLQGRNYNTNCTSLYPSSCCA